jgi:IclR family mhp operon transcriptional activator
MDERQEVKSLKKALRALTFLNVHGESTVTEVGSAIGVPRTTSYRLLETLASAGYVEKQSHSDLYRLTSLVQQLSSGFGDSDLVVEVAKPIIHQVGAEIGWPIAFATPRGKNMVVRITTDYDTSLVIDRYEIGFTTPILHAPSGFCYLAYCDETVRHAIVNQAQNTDSQPEVLRNGEAYLDYLLDRVRTRGYCNIVFPEYREGGLAVPVLIDGRAIGGLVMRYMKSTQRVAEVEAKFVPVLTRLAEDIAAAYEIRSDGGRRLSGARGPDHAISDKGTTNARPARDDGPALAHHSI